ncbi:CoA binding domain-domain-containing protein, partial [Clohesyomyces aquaticus]
MPQTRGQKQAEEMKSALKIFFSSPRFAVAGASSDPRKFGNRVFQWYLSHSLPVIPLNPRVPSISIRSTTYITTPSPLALPSPSSFSLSVITPPAVTKTLLQEAKEAGIPAVWLQPGSFDDEVLEYARREFKAAIAGDGGRGGEGWCVLVDGEEGMRIAGRE